VRYIVKSLAAAIIPILVIVTGSSSGYTPLRNAGAPLHVSVIQATDSEKVYSHDEVDKEATIKNIERVFSSFKKALDCDGEGVVKASYVLRDSGKVTDIKIENTMPCKGTEKAPSVLRKMRFTPAMKNHLRVSQSDSLEIKVETRLTIS
jgi:hypothetical protein